jgi:hypothetical protein
MIFSALEERPRVTKSVLLRNAEVDMFSDAVIPLKGRKRRKLK